MSKWIDVKDRLPEPETDVLVVCNQNGYVFVCPAIDEESDDYYIPEGWWENRKFNPDDVYNNLIDCAVTHWMPLPEPPKERID